MGYYENKKECVNKLLKTLEGQHQGVDKDQLYFIVLTNYGYGKNIVDNILKYFEAAGYVKVTETKVRWVVA